MHELKSYRDPYSYKRTSAMFGPYRRTFRWTRLLYAGGIFYALAVVGIVLCNLYKEILC